MSVRCRVVVLMLPDPRTRTAGRLMNTYSSNCQKQDDAREGFIIKDTIAKFSRERRRNQRENDGWK